MRNVQCVLLVDSNYIDILFCFCMSFSFFVFLVLMSVILILSQKNVIDH